MVSLISECRVCKSEELEKFLDFPELPLFDDVVTRERIGKEFTYQMQVFVCGKCFTAQSQHNVDIDSYYGNYQYNASDSNFIKNYMQSLAERIWRDYQFEIGDRVIDIGAADGFQLVCFKKLGATVLGFEPALNLVEIAKKNGVDVEAKLFNANTILELPQSFDTTKCVILLHTFDHLQEPFVILENIMKILDPVNGVLVIEIHDFEEMFVNLETSLFGHEHTIFLNKLSLRNLLRKAGLKVIDYELIPKVARRGTSMVVLASPGNSKYKEAHLEISSGNMFFELETYKIFAENVEIAFNNLRSYVKKQNELGIRLVGYGGWGRGITFLAMGGFTDLDFKFICDKNSSLHGNYTPRSHIPIVDPIEIVRQEIDEVIVFNHAYISEILEEQKEFLAKGGTITSVLSILRGEKT